MAMTASRQTILIFALVAAAVGTAAAAEASDAAPRTPAQVAIEALKAEPEPRSRRRADCASEAAAHGHILNRRVADAAKGQGPVNAIVRAGASLCP
ncbi:MAG: hypothetical protein AAF899_06315 [Pseudomonadota bacterium]